MSDNPETTLKHALQHRNSLLGALFVKLKEIQDLQKILETLVEPKLAAACMVANVEKNCLTVITHSALWATRFRFQAPQLLEKLQTHDALKSLKSISCKIMPKHVISAESTLNLSAPMQSLSPETAKLIVEAAQTIKNERLKAIMEKISRQLKIGD